MEDTALSITISRTLYIEDEITLLRDWFISKKWDYLLVKEYGEAGKHQHIHSLVWAKDKKGRIQKTSNFRRSLISKFPDYEYTIISLRIKNHTDPLFQLGYCQKENPDVLFTSLEEGYLEQGKLHYDERKENEKDSKDQQDWVCVGINHSFVAIFKWCEDNNVTQYRQIQPLVQVMCGVGALPISLGSKINKKKHQVMWSTFLSVNENVGRGETSFDSLIEEALREQDRIDNPILY